VSRIPQELWKKAKPGNDGIVVDLPTDNPPVRVFFSIYTGVLEYPDLNADAMAEISPLLWEGISPALRPFMWMQLTGCTDLKRILNSVCGGRPKLDKSGIEFQDGSRSGNPSFYESCMGKGGDAKDGLGKSSTGLSKTTAATGNQSPGVGGSRSSFSASRKSVDGNLTESQAAGEEDDGASFLSWEHFYLAKVVKEVREKHHIAFTQIAEDAVAIENWAKFSLVTVESEADKQRYDKLQTACKALIVLLSAERDTGGGGGVVLVELLQKEATLMTDQIGSLPTSANNKLKWFGTSGEYEKLLAAKKEYLPARCEIGWNEALSDDFVYSKAIMAIAFHLMLQHDGVELPVEDVTSLLETRFEMRMRSAVFKWKKVR
jgi:hypothetical protein